MRKMSQFASATRAVTVKSPAPDWVLVVRREWCSSELRFPVGSICTIEQLAAASNFAALLDGHFVSWQPPSNRPRPQPVKRAPPAPPAARPKVEIIADPDPVQSRRLSIARIAKALGGDWTLATDIFLANPEGARLDSLARRVFAERESKRIPGMSLRRIVDEHRLNHG